MSRRDANRRQASHDVDVYDVYGRVVLVRGKARPLFSLEYGHFRAPLRNDVIPDITIEPMDVGESPDLVPLGHSHGISISDWSNPPVRIGYHHAVSGGFVSRWMEQLLQWPDKAFAHAGGVARNGLAHIFFAAGGAGKTSSVLHLLGRGFDYLADDWIIIGNKKAYAFPKTIHVFDYNLASSPDLCRRIYGRSFPRLHYHQVHLFLRTKLPSIIPGNARFTRGLRYAGEKALSGCELIPLETVSPGSRVAPPSQLSTCCWLQRYDGAHISIEDLHEDEMTNRVINIRLHERQRFIAGFSRLSAIRGGGVYSLETLERERETIRDSLNGVPTKLVNVPEHTAPNLLAETLADLAD